MKDLKVRIYKYLIKKMWETDPKLLYYSYKEFSASREAVSKASFEKFKTLRGNPAEFILPGGTYYNYTYQRNER